MTNWNYFDAPPDSYDAMLAAQQQQEEYEKQGQASTSKTTGKPYDRPSRKSKGKEKAREEPSNRPEYLDSDSEPEYSKPWRRSPPSSPEPNPLRMPPPHSFHAPLRTSLDMPVPGSKEAPRTFRGKYHEVERFIRHIEQLFTKNRVTDDKERCTLVMDYCSTNVQNVIRMMEYYRTPRWAGLRREILRMFDAERTQHKYRPVDVVSFAKETNKKSLNSMTQWRRYTVKYNTIAGGPYGQGRLSEENYLGYFWFGIPRDLRNSLEQRILQGRTLQDMTQYSMQEINLAAEWYFRRTRAEALLLDAAEFGFDEYDSDEDSDSESDASDSDSDYRRHRTKRNKRSSSGSRKSRETKGKARETKAMATKPKVKFAGNEEEIAGLIKQLNGMKIDDPDYGPTYFKVLTLDQSGNAVKCIKFPAGSQSSTMYPGFSRRTSYPPPASPIPPSSTAAAPQSASTSASAAATYPNNIPLGEQECYGCHGKGHRADRCDGLNDLVAKGVLARNSETRRVQWASGAPLRRYLGESMLQAVERTLKSQSGPNVMLTFVETLPGTRRAVETFYQTRTGLDETEGEFTDWDAGETDAESGSDGDKTIYLTVPKTVQFEEEGAQVFEADRTIPSTREARKSTFKGVYPPARPASIATPGRSPMRQATRIGSPKPPLTLAPPAVAQDAVPHDKPNGPLPATSKLTVFRPPMPPRNSPKKPSISEVTPVDARIPRFNPEEEDAEMSAPPPVQVREAPIARDPVNPVRARDAKDWPDPKAGIKSRPAPIRQSAISSTVNRLDVTNRVLDTKVEVSLRELMEVSKEVRTDFSEMIRARNPKVVLINAKKLTSAVVEMVTGDSTLWAIIDTGSQLNVIRGELARQKIKRVVDMTCVISMNDANATRATPALDGNEYEAAQALASLQGATNVSTSTQSTALPDPLTFLLDQSPSLTHHTVLPFNPMSLALLATQSIPGRATPPFTIPRVPYPSPSIRPLLPRRDTPFPFFDLEQRVQTQRLQLEVLESWGEGVVAESPVTPQETMPVIKEEEEGAYPMDVDEAHDSPTAPTPEEERPSLQPTPPALVATIANTESVDAAITELGLPVDRPPT
ncbi:hypothetical protein C8F01DRAFT_1263929, partial [Mycena amicta]